MNGKNIKKRKMCGNCGRIRKRDIERRYCPITASCAYPNRPADRCVFYTDKKVENTDSTDTEDDDVREE